jgi:hypothetical protein
MAIDWTQYKANSSEVIKRWTTHEGLVVSESWTREVRAMSDVYCDASYVRVWNPTTQTTETVSLGYQFECNSTYGHSTVDADAATLAEISKQDDEAKATRKAAQEAHALQQAEARRLTAHNAPDYGKQMRVVRGRKVAKGTVGQVFWMRDGRVGLDLTGRRNANNRRADVAWVDAAYLVNNAPLAA